jgi:dihydropyrimidinase
MITPSDFVRLVSTNIAKAFNIYPQKGAIAPGSDADVIILDPEAKHTISATTHHSKMDTNIYEGREVKGKVGPTPAGRCCTQSHS